MQEIPCARCGTHFLERYAVKGVLIDNMSRECYCSEECRDGAESNAFRVATGVPTTRWRDWSEAGRDFEEGDLADPFAE